ncbi:hypothetical protein ACLOJK_024301 [Asimina triloba]
MDDSTPVPIIRSGPEIPQTLKQQIVRPDPGTSSVSARPQTASSPVFPSPFVWRSAFACPAASVVACNRANPSASCQSAIDPASDPAIRASGASRPDPAKVSPDRAFHLRLPGSLRPTARLQREASTSACLFSIVLASASGTSTRHQRQSIVIIVGVRPALGSSARAVPLIVGVAPSVNSSSSHRRSRTHQINDVQIHPCLDCNVRMAAVRQPRPAACLPLASATVRRCTTIQWIFLWGGRWSTGWGAPAVHKIRCTLSQSMTSVVGPTSVSQSVDDISSGPHIRQSVDDINSGPHISQSVYDISSRLHPTSVSQQWALSHIRQSAVGLVPHPSVSSELYPTSVSQRGPYIRQSVDDISSGPHISQLVDDNSSGPHISQLVDDNNSGPYIRQSVDDISSGPHISQSVDDISSGSHISQSVDDISSGSHISQSSTFWGVLALQGASVISLHRWHSIRGVRLFRSGGTVVHISLHVTSPHAWRGVVYPGNDIPGMNALIGRLPPMGFGNKIRIGYRETVVILVDVQSDLKMAWYDAFVGSRRRKATTGNCQLSQKMPSTKATIPFYFFCIFSLLLGRFFLPGFVAGEALFDFQRNSDSPTHKKVEVGSVSYSNIIYTSSSLKE